MNSKLPPFDVPKFERLLKLSGTTLGRPCHYAAVTGSTNDDLMALAKQGAPHGSLCIADFQSHGRGRHGNSWSSPRAAENLLFSVLLRPNFELATASSFTLAVGLAVRDAVAPHLSTGVGIKWTNDLYAEGRKLAGILVESQLRGNELSALVVGIGLNVHMTDFPDEIASIATSLQLLGSRLLDREQLLTDVLGALQKRTIEYEVSNISGIVEELRKHDAVNGQRVRVGQKVGIARGLDNDGALLLELETTNAIERQTTGLVEILSPAK
jgi:BirA family biotin operon repressor/biotin-[acetyl-CoA-carboxylase] ligase